MKILKLTALIAALTATPASATVISLNFEGIAPHPNGNNVLVQNYYNGGTSSNGSSGTNFGVGFSANSLAICLNTLSIVCSNTSRGGIGDPTSQLGGLFFLTGASSIMNVAAGFDTGFSFNYTAFSRAGSVGVYDGLNGTGALLATLALPTTTSGPCVGYNAQFCSFKPVGVSFSGIAKSVSFAGVANQIVFDDITFGSVTPGPGAVPEPATWAMMLVGFGVVGGSIRLRRRKSSLSFG
jgi:PEP-CTERM motif